MTAPCPALGFHVMMDSGALSRERFDALLDAWVDFLQARGLYCAGGGGSAPMRIVVASEASQATENDRVAAQAWLASRPELMTWHVGDLEDLSRDDQ